MAKGSRGLGRGLDALLSGDQDMDYSLTEIDITLIRPRPDQPRQVFGEQALSELAESIKQHGMLQPILLRPVGDIYQIVAGERRWRAAKMADVGMIPAIIRDFNDRLAAEISLVENLQREDLNVVEEARALQQLIQEYDYTQEQLGERIGKSRSHVANTLRILQLPEEVLDMIEKGELSAGHARTLVGLEAGRQVIMARRMVGQHMSVREAERETIKYKGKKDSPEISLEIREIQDQLQSHLGARVKIMGKKKGGRIEIPYNNDEDLERILEIIGISLG